MKIERRYIPVTELRVVRSDGKAPVIRGYAAVFNKLSENLGGFREKIAPGAFKGAIAISDVRSLFNHDSNFVLGRMSSGTLEVKEDREGLLMEVIPPDTQWARDLMVSIDRGDINQQSFGFTVETDQWEEKEGADTIRTLIKIRQLFDVGPVTFPAYPDTSVATRSLEEWRKQKSESNQNEPPDGTVDGEPDAEQLRTHMAMAQARQRHLNLRKRQFMG